MQASKVRSLCPYSLYVIKQSFSGHTEISSLNGKQSWQLGTKFQIVWCQYAQQQHSTNGRQHIVQKKKHGRQQFPNEHVQFYDPDLVRILRQFSLIAT